MYLQLNKIYGCVKYTLYDCNILHYFPVTLTSFHCLAFLSSQAKLLTAQSKSLSRNRRPRQPLARRLHRDLAFGRL